LAQEPGHVTAIDQSDATAIAQSGIHAGGRIHVGISFHIRDSIHTKIKLLPEV
jgi:hypothetical protein